MNHEEYKRKALEPIVNYIESVMASYSKEELEARIKKALPKKESEDEKNERIRKFIVGTIFRQYGDSQEYLDVLAYLEKQKEPKPVPKFYVGDYVIDTNYKGDPLYQIVGIDKECYICEYRGDKEMGDRAVMHFTFDNPYLRLEQKPVMIQWTGKNLKEVIDFTGKSPKFGEWFKSWEDFENYVHNHDDILKLFCEDGGHYEVPVGAWIVKTPDGYNIPSRSRFVQKPAEWSEEDEENFKWFDKFFRAESIVVGGRDIPQDKYLWFKSLYPQSKAKLTLLDENIINAAVAFVEQNDHFNCWGGIDKHTVIKALRSLKPHWKPSEEQISALERAIVKMHNPDDISTLVELRDNLKKV